jgi:hypothetical protein
MASSTRRRTSPACRNGSSPRRRISSRTSSSTMRTASTVAPNTTAAPLPLALGSAIGVKTRGAVAGEQEDEQACGNKRCQNQQPPQDRTTLSAPTAAADVSVGGFELGPRPHTRCQREPTDSSPRTPCYSISRKIREVRPTGTSSAQQPSVAQTSGVIGPREAGASPIDRIKLA